MWHIVNANFFLRSETSAVAFRIQSIEHCLNSCVNPEAQSSSIIIYKFMFSLSSTKLTSGDWKVPLMQLIQIFG